VGDYTVIGRDEATDVMAEYPGYGELRMLTGALGCEQVAVSWRRMPEGTGGKGSYGHRHHTQEEILYLISGRLQVKLDDDVVGLEPGMAVRMPPRTVRSIHNDGPGDAELMLVSQRIDDLSADVEKVEDFWPQ
jgi:mannose-6-phosphate isomerase-like protein (cupin superfamily)